MAFRVRIAATRADWINLFGKTKADERLRFYVCDVNNLGSMAPMRLNELQDLGTARSGILVQEAHYIVLPVTEQAAPREIRQNNGKSRYVLDQRTNPDSFIFWPGGIWKNDCYLYGEIASLHNVGLAAAAAKQLRGVMQRTFEYRGTYWIGPECRSLYTNCTFTDDCRYSM